MPRDGSGIYSQPFPAVVEGTTIESTVYNGYTADITIDLNTPRPISSGGTGANNAADAMAALGGEGSKIEVTNYDSHAFTAGSFYSKASASNPPVAGHAFAGICYVAVVSGIATSDMFIEVRDRDEATQPGSLFVRQKKNGTWSGWLKAVGTTTGATPPTAPTDGMLWWDPTQGKLFIWYSDPNTAQWVEAVATPDLGPDDFVSVDVAQNFTEAEKKTARSNIYAAPFDAMAYNGMQINGSMEVAQENPINTQIAGGQYVCDGWRIQYASAGAGVVRAIVLPAAGGLSGFRNMLSSRVLTAQTTIGAGDVSYFLQYIEGYRFSRLGFGTANASPVTIGFWAYSAARTGLCSGSLRNGAADRSYIFTFSINAVATWEYKTITIPGDITGAWAADNTAGASLSICVMAGSTSITTPSVWATGSFIGATGTTNFIQSTSDILAITGVVVLPGIEAPSAARSSLIMRPYDQELVTCKRYWHSSYDYGVPPGTADVQTYISMLYQSASTTLYGNYVYPVPMRAQPTISTWGYHGEVNVWSTIAGVAAVGGGITAAGRNGFTYKSSIGGLVNNTIYITNFAADARL